MVIGEYLSVFKKSCANEILSTCTPYGVDHGLRRFRYISVISVLNNCLNLETKNFGSTKLNRAVNVTLYVALYKELRI